MISLKKYLDSPRDDPKELWEPDKSCVFSAAIQGYRAALRGMGCCSLEACPALGAELKQNLGRLEEGLSGEISGLAIAKSKSDAQQHLQEWGGQATDYRRQKTREVKEFLFLMVHTAESFGKQDRLFAGQLTDATERLEEIASLDDLAEVRASILESAAELKASAERITAEGERAISLLKAKVAGYQVKLEEAEEIASRDPMTGLRNRLWVEKQIEHRMGSAAPFCVAVIDLDRFKEVNDNHGHLVGDELLRQFAAELQSANRSTDIIGRWGGDEFILVLDGNLSGRPAQIDRLTILVCKRYTIQSRAGPLNLKVNASIGVAEHIPGETIKGLLSRADSAMYTRKKECIALGASENLQPSTIEWTGPAPQPDAGQGIKKIRSLVAEDDATNRKLLQAVLSRYGPCDTAVDGKEAVNAIRLARENQQSYDLVCMDLRMPKMDGQEAIREIRKQEAIAGDEKAARIIVTTVHTDMENITGALLARCNAYLVKPIDTAKLRKELDALGLIQ